MLSWSYEVPIGNGKMLGRNWTGVPQAIFSNWKFNSIDTFQTGSPFSITSGVNTLNPGASQRANYIGGDVLVSNPGPSLWWNPAAFATPALYQYGTSGRNSVLGPGTDEIDLSLFKTIPLANIRERHARRVPHGGFQSVQQASIRQPGRKRREVRVEAPRAFPTSGTLNYAGNPSFFQRTSREIQFALKLYF